MSKKEILDLKKNMQDLNKKCRIFIKKKWSFYICG
jgi:hypothetical protein